MTRRQRASGSQTFDVVGAVNGLRQLIAKTESFASTADEKFEDVRNDRRRHERLAWIVSEAAVSAQAALDAINRLIEKLAKHGVGT